MTGGIAYRALAVGLGLFLFGMAGLLNGCSRSPFAGGETRAAWRDQEEARCMASGAVQRSPYITPISSVDGRYACSIEQPLKVEAVLGGRVQLKPAAVTNCPMTAALERWMHNDVQRAAFRYFGQPVVEVRQMSSYSCRTRNSQRGAKLSEHGYGNAIDIGGFRFADGHYISVRGGWSGGSAADQAFLREVYNGACDTFFTVLGPGGDRYHSDHIHLDLLVTNASNGTHYCRPRKMRVPPAGPSSYPQRTPMVMAPQAGAPGMGFSN